MWQPIDSLPRSTKMSEMRYGNLLLTNAVWENSYGSYQPETGVRFMDQIHDGRPRFELVQHGRMDFVAANDLIIRGIRKGWDTSRITDFLRLIKERKRPRATVR